MSFFPHCRNNTRSFANNHANPQFVVPNCPSRLRQQGVICAVIITLIIKGLQTCDVIGEAHTTPVENDHATRIAKLEKDLKKLLPETPDPDSLDAGEEKEPEATATNADVENVEET